MKTISKLLTIACWIGALTVPALAQFTPSQDAFTESSKPTINFGAATTLGVENSALAIQTTYIQFDLSSIPAGFTGSNVAKATLKLYVNTVGTAGSLNVDFINGTWSEKTLDANNAPALGSSIASSIPLAPTNKNDYLLIDVSSAVEAWLNGTQINDGIALVANSPLASTFDSKENTAQGHPPELDIVFNGAITGVDTAPGSGLTGGGAIGTLDMSLLKTCNSSQVLQWNGSSWACSNAGTGTVTGVTAGSGLTGGGTGGNVTLNLDTTKVPLLNTSNTFTGAQNINGPVGIGTTTPTTTLDVKGNNSVFTMLVESPSNFGTWLNLSNTSSGARQWSIISTASTNGEGAGNLAFFTNDTSRTIFMHSNLRVDSTLEVSGVNNAVAIVATGPNAPAGSGHPGSDGIRTFAGNGDPNNLTFGGNGIVAVGGKAGGSGGAGGSGIDALGGSDNGTDTVPSAGGFFTGGAASNCAGINCGGDGINASPGLNGSLSVVDGYAGNFNGDINVSGTIFAGGKDFRIDHPLDPANKYLLHASVESSEMMNIYTGNVTTDAGGEATVQLPDWFEVLNTDFRYQLTVIGVFAQAIVAREIENHQFAIRTSLPNVKVSWQVTGVRQDAFAKAHPLLVEQEKDPRVRGYYLHPELYGATDEKQIEWVRHPEMMRRMKEIRAKQLVNGWGDQNP